MKKVTKDQWETKLFPMKQITSSISMSYTDAQMERIQRGFLPRVMEEKWFIYWEDMTLYFFRSWTGFALFEVDFMARDAHYFSTVARLNRDEEQYSETDELFDCALIFFLIHRILLGEEVAYPLKDSREVAAVVQWSSVGKHSIPVDEDVLQHRDIPEFEIHSLLLRCHIAGFYFGDGEALLNRRILHEDQCVTLQRDKENKYDRHAVMVLLDGVKLGYIPKTKNIVLANLLDAGYGDCIIVHVTGVDRNNKQGQQVAIELHIKQRPLK